MKKLLVVELTYLFPLSPSCGSYICPIVPRDVFPLDICTHTKLMVTQDDSVVEKLTKIVHGLANFEHIVVVIGTPYSAVTCEYLNDVSAEAFIFSATKSAHEVSKINNQQVTVLLTGQTEISNIEKLTSLPHEEGTSSNSLSIVTALPNRPVQYIKNGENISNFSDLYLYFTKIVGINY